MLRINQSAYIQACFRLTPPKTFHLELALGHNGRVALPDLIHSTLHHLVDDLPRRLALVDNRTGLAHQERPGIIHGVIVDIIAHALQVVLHRNYTLGRQLLDLLRTLDLPVVDVRVVAHAQRAAGEDDCADVVVEAGGADGFLVRLGSTSLLGEDEAGADPDSTGAESHGGCQTLAVEETASGHDLDVGAQTALLALAHGCDGGDEDGSGHVAGVAATLATLSADEVGTKGKALGHVLGVADHVHVEDAGLVEAVDNGFGWDTDGRHEEASAGVNDDGGELVKLALGVVVAGE